MVTQPSKLYPSPKLQSYITKILQQTKSSHSLKIDNKTGDLNLSQDCESIGTIFAEAPFILIPKFELLKLIELGKCCSYCGDVLKVYDQGRMRDLNLANIDGVSSSGNGGRKNIHSKANATAEKHDRFLSGLDCNECESCWCSEECKELDFRHKLIYHTPTNKSMAHKIPHLQPTCSFSNNGRSNLFFSYEGWLKLKDYILKNQLDLIYYGVMTILHLIHDEVLIEVYESLRCYNGLDDLDADSIAEILNELEDGRDIDYQLCYEMFINCFKSIEVPYEKFLKYLVLFRLNNYNGSIYLLFSYLNRSSHSNFKVGYHFIDQTNANNNNNKKNIKKQQIEEYDDYKIEKCEKSVKLIKQHHLETIKKPIFTNKSSSGIAKKILKFSNTEPLKTNSSLSIRDMDYFNPGDDDESTDESSSDDLSDSSSSIEVSDDEFPPKLLFPPPSSSDSNPKLKDHKRTASFTSSGNSFGEGIIKYNRDQIREMLLQMSIEDDKDDAIVVEEIITSHKKKGKNKKGNKGNKKKNSFSAAGVARRESITGQSITSVDSKEIELEVPAGFGKRRKSVRFEE